jgi:hypothetical protein
MAPSEVLDPPTLRGNAPDAGLGRSRTEVSRAFGFLVHDVSRLIKRRFERRARQLGLPITRQQAAVVLNIAGNEGVSQAEVAAWLDIEPIALSECWTSSMRKDWSSVAPIRPIDGSGRYG